MFFVNLLPMGVRKAILPLMLGLSAICLSPAVVAQAANVTGVASALSPSGNVAQVPLPGVETLGWSGLIGFLIYMLDRKDKSAQEALKGFTESLGAKDKTIQEMSMSYGERVEKFLEEAQDLRAGEADRFHTLLDKLIDRALPSNGGAAAGGSHV